MGVHVMAEGAIVSCRPVPMRPKPVQSFRGKSGGGRWNVDDNSGLGVISFQSLAPSDGTESGGVYI
jgi:hypothetical protein